MPYSERADEVASLAILITVTPFGQSDLIHPVRSCGTVSMLNVAARACDLESVLEDPVQGFKMIASRS
jgi:hypothetical protein